MYVVGALFCVCSACRWCVSVGRKTVVRSYTLIPSSVLTRRNSCTQIDPPNSNSTEHQESNTGTDKNKKKAHTDKKAEEEADDVGFFPVHSLRKDQELTVKSAIASLLDERGTNFAVQWAALVRMNDDEKFRNVVVAGVKTDVHSNKAHAIYRSVCLLWVCVGGVGAQSCFAMLRLLRVTAGRARARVEQHPLHP